MEYHRDTQGACRMYYSTIGIGSGPVKLVEYQN